MHNSMRAAAVLAGCVFLPFFSSVGRASIAAAQVGLAPPPLVGDVLEVSLLFRSSELDLGTPKREPTVRLHEPAEHAPELAIRPVMGLITYSDFTVGHTALSKLRERTSDLNWRMPASTNTAAEWAFIRREVIGPEGLDALEEMFDVNEDERPWSDTTTVHVLAPTGDFIVPFATVAHEVDSLDVYDRYGLGGGAQMTIGKNTTIGTEMIYFGERLNDANVRETRVMAHLEIQF